MLQGVGRPADALGIGCGARAGHQLKEGLLQYDRPGLTLALVASADQGSVGDDALHGLLLASVVDVEACEGFRFVKSVLELCAILF